MKIRDLSPLRYPGSKKNLVPYLIDILRCNNLSPDILVEPFVGGASVCLHFLAHDIVRKAIVSDKDRLISSFWTVAFRKPQHLIHFVKHVKVNLEEFYKYKAIANNASQHDTDTLAEACLYLNRTSYSGLLTPRVGPLGGKDQRSKYKIDCRFNRETLIGRIRDLSRFSGRVTVLHSDWRGVLDYVGKWLDRRKTRPGVFFYFDPPFYRKANELYRVYLRPQEHRALSQQITQLEYDWVLSYDNAPEIREMYSRQKLKKVNIELPYSLNSNAKRREKELIITPLRLPADSDCSK